MTADLVAFLRGRLDEDERAARAMAEFYPTPWEAADRGWMARVMADGPSFWEVTRLEQWSAMPTGVGAPDLGEIIAHVARHDPARVLAEVVAKRAVIKLYEEAVETIAMFKEHGRTATHYEVAAESYLNVLYAHAYTFRDRPGYREEWMPDWLLEAVGETK